MTEKLNALGLGYAAAIISAAGMLLLSIANLLGIYKSAVQMMQQWHMFYAPTVYGTITGMIEAAVIGFVFVYAFGRIYNKFA